MSKGTGNAYILLCSLPRRYPHELHERGVGFKLRRKAGRKDETTRRDNNQYQRDQVDRALRSGEQVCTATI